MVADLNTGALTFEDKDSATDVQTLCVRRTGGIPDPVPVRFERRVDVADQPIVVDSITGLTWMGCADGQTGELLGCEQTPVQYSQTTAVSQCPDMTGGYGGISGGWRLPDVKELASLVDPRLTESTAHPLAFPDFPNAAFWSSTPDATNPTMSAWSVSFINGRVTTEGNTVQHYVLCVHD
jgi:hypothetical protein